ncbi:MAG TPA: hypothetical protein VFM18_17700 [Methanosarcina sp.]|nr:hypothetical protein [Methanosarcina sp.]
MIAFCLLLVAIAACGFFQIRNFRVYNIRTSIVFSDFDLYETLPSYNEMVFHPAHWFKWRVSDYTKV